MITENLSTLKIHKLMQAQYDRELATGNLDENALYLTPDDTTDNTIIREFDSGLIKGQSYSYQGTNAKFYIITYQNTQDSTIKTIVVDGAAITWGYIMYHLDETEKLMAVTTPDGVMFESPENFQLIHICGYY